MEKRIYVLQECGSGGGYTLMEKDTGSFEDIARNKLAQAIDDLESADSCVQKAQGCDCLF